MKLLAIILCISLTACVSVPVEKKFPALPDTLKQPCSDLELVQPTTKLTDVLTTVTNNYALYHECKAKVDLWQEWYNTQRKIYE